MKTITKKILTVIIMTLLLYIYIPLYSNASTIDDIIKAGNNFLTQESPSSGSVAGTITDSDLIELSNTVSGVLLTIALAVTLISGGVMGINFTIQSVEDKAKIKESMIPWIIGIFISFGAYGIWKLTMNVFYKLIISSY